MEYYYITVPQNRVQSTLDNMSSVGWKVNAFFRASGSGSIEILFERSKRKPKAVDA